MYLADGARVHKIGLDGSAHTIAGIGVIGVSGDGGPAIFAETWPNDLAVVAGVLYIAESSPPRIRKVGTDGNIVTVALLDSTTYLAANAAGDLLVSHNGAISKLNADGSLTQLAKANPAARGSEVVLFATGAFSERVHFHRKI